MDILISTSSFLGSKRIVIADILKWNNRLVVLQACMKWAGKACEANDIDASNPVNLRKVFGDSWDTIRFESLSADEFIMFEKVYPVFSFEEYKNILDAIMGKKKNKKVVDSTVISPRRLSLANLSCTPISTINFR